MSAVYGRVDAADDEQVYEYERHFYQAYARLADNKLVRLIWDWDDARQRTRTKIPYADQVIYTARDTGGRLAVAMAVNLNCLAAFQGEAFGFAPPGRAGDRCLRDPECHGDTAPQRDGAGDVRVVHPWLRVR
jgi:hypothetical protein